MPPIEGTSTGCPERPTCCQPATAAKVGDADRLVSRFDPDEVTSRLPLRGELREDDFLLLAKAFFAEIESKFL